MRAAQQYDYHQRKWETPTLRRFKLSASEIAQIGDGASPEAELLKIYRERSLATVRA